MSTPRSLDAHQHFWSPARGDYHWMTPDMTVLFRDYGPDDLRAHLDRYGIEGTILVQAAQTARETAWLLDLAERTPFVLGVVGWVDLALPDAAARISKLASNPLLSGLRPMVQDLDDDDWLLLPQLKPAIEAMIANDLVFDALVLPRHLPRLAAFLDRFEGLRVVLDHAGKPFIRDALLDPWRADIAAVAARPDTWCKVSGLVSEAAPDWMVRDLRPYVDHLCTVFGPERLMWGSDWPVVEAAGGYRSWRDAAETLLDHLDGTRKKAVFGGNAARVYLSGRGRA